MSLRALRERIGVLIVVLVVFAIQVAPANAIVANTVGGPVSYVPLNGAAAGGASPLHLTEPNGFPPLEYHGGPVMHSHTAYAIFWAPGGASEFPSGYVAAIESFFEDVAADSGKPTNVYSVSAQYTDETGHASYSDSFDGSVIDEHPYPTVGTCPAYKSAISGVKYTSCISDEKLAAEVEIEIAAKGWPHGLASAYYVVLPPNVGSCFGTSPKSGCFDEDFCAYHSYRGTPEPEPVPATVAIYANISYSPGDVFGCGVGEYPNGHANGNVDDTLSSLSHEANESITDPTLEAWFDFEGFENGDECRNTPEEDDFGPPSGGGAGALFNQEIGTRHYYLQREWSNDTEDCEQRVDPAQPVIADPGEVTINQPASFDSTLTVPGSGGIASYHWEFGDTATSTAANPSHTYTAPAAVTVKLTVTDDGGFSYSTEREVNVLSPAQLPEATTLSASAVTSSTATLNGSVNPMGRKTTYRFEYGTSTAYGSTTAAASAGSGSSAVAVSGGVGGLAPSTTYHFRLLATNAGGTEKGADQVFTTAAAPPGLPLPALNPSVGTAVAVGNAVVKAGSARLKLSCQGGGPCKGSLELLARVRTRRHGTIHTQLRSIGKAAFSLAAGTSAKVSVKLSSLGKSLVRAAGNRGLKATLRGSDITAGSLLLKKG